MCVIIESKVCIAVKRREYTVLLIHSTTNLQPITLFLLHMLRHSDGQYQCITTVIYGVILQHYYSVTTYILLLL